MRKLGKEKYRDLRVRSIVQFEPELESVTASCLLTANKVCDLCVGSQVGSQLCVKSVLC